MMKKYLFAVTLLLTAVSFLPSAAQAQSAGLSSPLELEGYAWSSTIGWISMNCSNNSSCGGSDYKVQINPNGSVTGYAWSSNIGWVRFGGLSGFPVSARVLNANAQVAGSYPAFTFRGWARACAGAANVSACSGGANAAAGGWDGWISLGDLNGTYNIVTNSSGATAGSYAWGDDVVGWIDFSPVTLTVPAPAIISFTANPTEVATGGNSTLTYNVSNVTSCTASNNNGDSVWTGSVASTPGNTTVSVTPPAGVTVYTLSCTNGANVVTDTVTVTSKPDILIVNPTVNPGEVNISGEYPNVVVRFIINGIPNGITNVPYRVTFNGTNVTGTVNGTGGPRVVTASFTNVPFGDALPYRIEVDHTPSPFGRVEENIASTPADEDDNTYNGVTTLDRPEPEIAITGPSIVRSGETVSLEVSVTAPYPVNCTVQGPGINQTVATTGTPGAPGTNTITVGPSAALTSTASFEMTCDVGSSPETFLVEVVPTYQEI